VANSQITIRLKGLALPVSAPYSAGHTLNEAEASQLNQVRAENVRNNISGEVNDILVAAGVELVSDLPEEKQAEILENFRKYDSEYEFGARRAVERDPVKAEAIRIGMEKVAAAFMKKNPSLKRTDLTTKILREAVEKNWERYGPTWMQTAQETLALRKGSGDDDLEVGDVAPASSNGETPAETGEAEQPRRQRKVAA
jgi:hypothetical protein